MSQHLSTIGRLPVCACHTERRHQRRRLIAVITTLLMLASAAGAATTWTVTTTQDDAAPGVTCNSDNSCYTLRDAIHSAAPGDTIAFDLVGYTLPATIELTAGALQLTTPGITIHGPGFDQLAISGQGLDRVFVLPDQASTVLGITIDNLTIRDGRITGADGAAGASATTAGAAGTAGSNGESASGGCIDVGEHQHLSLNLDLVTACVAIGGKGGAGGAGGAGTAGADADPLSQGQPGGDGGAGGSGGNGGNGGGAFGGAIAVAGSGYLGLFNTTVTGSVADGGAGGDGGPGAAGGAGGSGSHQPCQIVVGHPCVPIGQGGAGGDGGHGGDGGAGGSMGWSAGGAIAGWGQVYVVDSTLADNLAIDGLSFFGPAPTGGNGGLRGDGGAGGQGGAGTNPGPDGLTGIGGAGGGGGNGGTAEGGALFHYNTNTALPSILMHATLAFNSVIAGSPGLGANGSASGNPGWNSGGGIQNQSGGAIRFLNSIIASNSRTDSSGTDARSNCTMNGAPTLMRHNFSDDNSCGADLHGDAKFAPEESGVHAYAWGGNKLPVVMLMPGSAAIDGAVDDGTGGCAASQDERGIYRHALPIPSAYTCDLGAVESDVIFIGNFEN